MRNLESSMKMKGNRIRFNYIEAMENHLLEIETKLNKRGILSRWILNDQDFIKQITTSLTKPNNNRVCLDTEIIDPAIFDNHSSIKLMSPTTKGEIPDLHIIQADFGIVENGMLVIIDKKSSHLIGKAKNIVILLEITDLVVKAKDLDHLLFLKYHNKQQPSNFKMITAPYKIPKESVGFDLNKEKTEEKVNLSLYFYDNGTSEIIGNPVLREALYCIKCGKCSEVCPVFALNQKNTPIQLVRKNCYEEERRTGEIFENTTLCGNCSEICPVQIPLHDMMIAQMQLIKGKYKEQATTLANYFSKRSKMNKLHSFFYKIFFLRKLYRKNKKLYNYYSEQKVPFYNITQTKLHDESDD